MSTDNHSNNIATLYTTSSSTLTSDLSTGCITITSSLLLNKLINTK